MPLLLLFDTDDGDDDDGWVYCRAMSEKVPDDTHCHANFYTKH
mgnify:CR=1 FL=1